MRNKIWGYVRPRQSPWHTQGKRGKYLLLGVITATTLSWGMTVAPAAASTIIPSSLTINALYRHSGEPRPGRVTPESYKSIYLYDPGQGTSDVPSQDDGKKQRDLALSLPFSVDSHWTSVSDSTLGINWQTGTNEIRFGIQNGQFVAGDHENDTWFVYGWFGALEAIKQPYNVKYPEWGDRHNGIDFAGKEGIDIISASAGRVIFAGKKIGNTVIIDAGNRYQITYGHLQDISVKKGQKTKVGDLIGHLGRTGTTNPHLHFQVDYINGSTSSPLHRIAVNPVPLFDVEWGSIIIPDTPANQFHTDNQNPFTQPDFSW